MVLLIVASTLVGAMLGWLRFKILILLPAILAGLAMTIVAGIVSSAGTWSIVLQSVIVTACLQWGYLAGLAMVSLRGGTQSRRSWTAPRKRDWAVISPSSIVPIGQLAALSKPNENAVVRIACISSYRLRSAREGRRNKVGKRNA